MTDKLRQAAETAIWNLEAIATSDWRRWEDSATPERFEAWVKHKADYAANALRQALAEPSGCAECGKGNGYALYCVSCHNEFKTWVGLTDADYQAILVEHDNGGLLLFYHLIENKLKALNSQS